ncbi:MAG: DEAD/DEAH box helicase, partial [Elusimicrobia bacterium]|nr:DEAD/DEAH box helicase [Elusimicrobiota bacterium]
SEELSRLREELAERVPGADAAAWLKAECGVSEGAAEQAGRYVEAQKAAVGFVPTQTKVLFERFFDESGGMQLVIHSPFGARVNRAWGLALRKRFCRTFDFELQASADDDGVVLSLGAQHSFPLEQLFGMLRPAQAREVLVQALLAAPMFQLRWRWNATRALAVLRSRGGKKVPPALQRFRADDLLTAVFPLQTACFENRPPEVPVPDHPLVAQTVYDCLHEAMDLPRFERLLADIEAGKVELVARDTREPSPFSHAILNANPYAFLDDAPLEERRARAVAARRALAPEELRDLARLDPAAIARVREDAWPTVRDEEELHDALLSLGALPAHEGRGWTRWFERLQAAGRACAAAREAGPALWLAAERWPVVRAAFPDARPEPAVALPAELDRAMDADEAALALVRGRLEVSGPVEAERLAATLGLSEGTARVALAALEGEGFALQGRFSDPAGPLEFCERRLLARIHRLTLEGARRRIQPVAPETYWRFLAELHHLVPDSRREGRLGLYEAVGQLQGFESAASAWETDLLPARVEKYELDWLDTLSFSGELVWGRLRPARKPDAEAGTASLTRVAPLALAFRAELGWLLPPERLDTGAALPASATPAAVSVYQALRHNGALFFDDLVSVAGLLPTQVKDALGELAALGAVTSDGFSALRGLVLAKAAQGRRRWSAPRRAAYGRGGRWTLFPGRVAAAEPEERLKLWAWQLLRRYGVVFRDLLARESAAPSWWELAPIFRRLETRGEVRGGRFVAGVAGEQFALTGAVEALRKPRDPEDAWMAVSAADPLNLAGILDDGPRVPATRGNRLLYKNGRVAAAYQGGELQFRQELAAPLRETVSRLLRLAIPGLRHRLLAELR